MYIDLPTTIKKIKTYKHTYATDITKHQAVTDSFYVILPQIWKSAQFRFDRPTPTMTIIEKDIYVC